MTKKDFNILESKSYIKHVFNEEILSCEINKDCESVGRFNATIKTKNHIINVYEAHSLHKYLVYFDIVDGKRIRLENKRRIK